MLDRGQTTYTKKTSMSSHSTELQGSVINALREAIERQIPDSRAEVNGGGHFNIEVTSPVFASKNVLQSQRMCMAPSPI